jgi:hypothetical protein
LEKITAQYDYLATWTNNPENWKAASPIYFIDKIRLLLIICRGTNLWFDKTANNQFLKNTAALSADVSQSILIKNVPMVTQYFWPWNNRIDEVDFMKLQIK